jgi:hypothetical protein
MKQSGKEKESNNIVPTWQRLRVTGDHSKSKKCRGETRRETVTHSREKNQPENLPDLGECKQVGFVGLSIIITVLFSTYNCQFFLTAKTAAQ